jgi:hypothetical protein
MKIMKKYKTYCFVFSLAGMLSFLPTTSIADCKNIIFACSTKTGKKVEVCDKGQVINYSFGNEISIEKSRSQVTTQQWKGVGRWHSYSVNIPNGEFVYDVHFSYDSLCPSCPLDAGVYVEKHGQIQSQLLCIEDTIINNLEGVNLKSSDE